MLSWESGESMDNFSNKGKVSNADVFGGSTYNFGGVQTGGSGVSPWLIGGIVAAAVVAFALWKRR